MPTTFTWVVAYDITSPRRLWRAARILKDYGARRQKSVFLCRRTTTKYRGLRDELQGAIDAEEDSVVFYRPCADCVPYMDSIGLAFEDDREETHVFV